MVVQIDELQSDIEKLQNGNIEKQNQLNDLANENKQSLEKIIVLEELNEKAEHSKKSRLSLKSESLSLQQELHFADEMSLGEIIECNYCEKMFFSKREVKKHIQTVHMQTMKSKLLELERNAAEQSKEIVQSLYELKQKELKEKVEPCKCKGFCRIYHGRFNWKKFKSDLIFEKFREVSESLALHSCNNRSKSFEYKTNVDEHIGRNHGETESGEVELI